MTQYLRRADEQLSCHLSLRLSFWLKTTHPCNRNYLELDGNLWPLSLSLLFASVSILLPPSLRGILSSLIPSILPSFSLVDGNMCFSVQGWLFLEMGEIGPHCGQAGTGDSENALRLGQQPKDERLFRWRLAWEVDMWRMWCCEGWGGTSRIFIFSDLLFFLYYSVLKMPFIGLLLHKCAPCAFILYFSGSIFPGHSVQEKDLFLWASSCILWTFLQLLLVFLLLQQSLETSCCPPVYVMENGSLASILVSPSTKPS